MIPSPEADAMLEEILENGLNSKQRLRVNNAPDVHFKGKMSHEYTTQSKDKSKDRWTELRLWETEGGAWIAEKVGCSSRSGEAELRDVLVIEGVTGEFDEFVDDTTRLAVELQAQEQVMAFFGWTVVAKAFAKQAGWDVVRHVG